MYVLEDSDCAIVPMKLTNNEGKTSAEPVEGRAQTKENDAQPHTHPTQSGARVSQGLGGVRQTARARKQERFSALLHHLTIDLLRESYYVLQRSAAPGVDGVSWQQYEQGLEARLGDPMAGCTVERIGRKPREECTYRRPMAGDRIR
jgi:RNA-directed DNA polymerase